MLVQLEHESDLQVQEEIHRRLRQLNPKRHQSHSLSLDLFKSISDWYHAAILEMTYSPHFQVTAEKVAEVLGIAKVDAQEAIDRLLRLELLERSEQGQLLKSHHHVYSEAEVPTIAYKKFHEQLLTRASVALLKQTPKERISATDVLAIDSKYIEQVDRLSREFSASVLKLADKSAVKDHVYALSVHFFKLTNSQRSL